MLTSYTTSQIFGLESDYCDYGYCVAFLSISKQMLA